MQLDNQQKKKRREGKKEEKHPIIKIFPRGSYIMFDTLIKHFFGLTDKYLILSIRF